MYVKNYKILVVQMDDHQFIEELKENGLSYEMEMAPSFPCESKLNVSKLDFPAI